MMRHRWVVGLVAAAALAGAGVFFAVQGLGRADQYASVASFLLALATSGFAVLDRARARLETPPAPSGGPTAPAEVVTNNYRISDNDVVQTGPRSVAIVNRGNEPPGTKRHRR
jgi:hypothetical protein